MVFRVLVAELGGLAALVGASPAPATEVVFNGAVANLCVLTLSTPGTLGTLGSGTTLTSDDVASGGVNAVLAVASTGTNPTISFSAPTLIGPSSAAAAVKQISYSSTGGANQTYTSDPSVYVMSRLIDTMTVRGRITNPAGFVTGTYHLVTTVTCQQ